MKVILLIKFLFLNVLVVVVLQLAVSCSHSNEPLPDNEYITYYSSVVHDGIAKFRIKLVPNYIFIEFDTLATHQEIMDIINGEPLLKHNEYPTLASANSHWTGDTYYYAATIHPLSISEIKLASRHLWNQNHVVFVHPVFQDISDQPHYPETSAPPGLCFQNTFYMTWLPTTQYSSINALFDSVGVMVVSTDMKKYATLRVVKSTKYTTQELSNVFSESNLFIGIGIVLP